MAPERTVAPRAGSPAGPGRRRLGARRLLGLTICLLVGSNPGLADTTVHPTGSYSIKDSPGYYPPADPESMSVVIGRRVNAPLVQKRFQGGARSLDELGRAVCRAIHHRHADSLFALCVRQDEFRDIMWREFPQSRPATGLTWEDAWQFLFARLNGGCRSAVSDLGGTDLQFLRFERSDTTARYRNFKLHNGLILVARGEAGEIERYAWLRSVAERKGVYKIYSMRD